MALAALLAVVLAQGERDAAAAVVPPGFVDLTIARDLNQPTSFDFAPDGRIFITEKPGVIRVVKDGQLLAAPVLDLRDQVNDFWDRGMLSIALDPNFATNHHLYVLYVYDNPLSGYGEAKNARLSRFTVEGDYAPAQSEVVILGTYDDGPCATAPAGADCLAADSPYHTAADVRFAPDGTMFVALGDSGFNTENDLSLRAQDLDSLAGKILHIYVDGTGVETNPFWNDDPSAPRSKVYAYGFRNPFRISFRPGSGSLYAGDVGWTSWEEVNVVQRGANYGWPCYEGLGPQPAYVSYPVCQQLYFHSGSARAPLYSYPTAPVGASVIGGDFPLTYPAPYNGQYFFADYVHSTVRYLTVDGQDQYVSVQDFATAADGPVALRRGPDGELYYAAINTGRLRHIHWTAGNQSPVAIASADPTSGLRPLTVQFSSAESADPNGDPLTYNWDFGDGSAPSTDENPVHTYTADGVYTATLTVNDGHSQSTDTVAISVGRPPVVTITAPQPDLQYRTGDTISHAGYAVDPDDGPLAESSLTWTVTLHHLSHNHFFTTTSGSEGDVVVPDHGDSSWFEIALTAQDSSGLTTTQAVYVYPLEVQLSIDTAPTGFWIVYEGRLMHTPATITAIANSLRHVTTPSPQADDNMAGLFQAWSDGGAVDHAINTGTSDLQLTATFESIPMNVDTDRDGCLDGREISTQEARGGRRDRNNFWDFFDVWTPQGLIRNGTLVRDEIANLWDVLAIAGRFARTGPPGTVDDALQPPTSNSGYHAAFDRTFLGPDPWDLGPPDGVINLREIYWAIAQAYHNCI